jgi:phosphopentomutase
MNKRIFLFVLDGFGVGESEDAKLFNDEGSNTFENVNSQIPLKIPTLTKLGLKNIDGLHFEKQSDVFGAYGKLRELSKGKDTTTGHFEMMGIISKEPMPTYPKAFPEYIIKKLEEAFGTKVLGNKVASGTEIIKELGDEHIKTGYPIVYTSADSVLQIATHTDIVPLEKLYEYCAKARQIMTGKDAVGRIIARPFFGKSGNYVRLNDGRKDFSVIPDKNNTMQKLFDAGIKVISVGKISEIFADQAITEKYVNHNNKDAMIASKKIQQNLDEGFVFINFVDTDMLYGHRNDVEGYAKSLEETDKFLSEFIQNLRDNDIIMVTGDHGNDPTTSSTDHSREFAPIVIYGKNIKQNVNLGTMDGFDNIGKFIEDYFLKKPSKIGEIVWKN